MTEAQVDLKKTFRELLEAGHHYPLRGCSICDATLYYSAREGALYFHSECDCSHLNPTPPREQTWEHLDFYFEPQHGHIPRITAWCEELTRVREALKEAP